jgi:hypothetical protein
LVDFSLSNPLTFAGEEVCSTTFYFIRKPLGLMTGFSERLHSFSPILLNKWTVIIISQLLLNPGEWQLAGRPNIKERNTEETPSLGSKRR